MVKIKSNSEKTAQRITRIIGQLKGIQKMLEAERDCGAVLLQISAVKAAVNNLGLEIARSEVCNIAPEHKDRLERVLKEIGRI